jgi:hypothetical protein
MKESTIRDFFLGKAPAAALALPPSTPAAASDKTRPRAIAIDDLDSTFLVTRPMAAVLCDAAISGEVSPHLLGIVARSLFGSRHFTWEDPLLTEVMGSWSEIGGDHTIPGAGLQDQRNRLLRSESYAKRDLTAAAR